jgi:hypothetical protein
MNCSSYNMSPLYEEVGIHELAPGPRRVSFTGRVVNMYDQNIESKMPKAARGCLKLLVKDALAMIMVGPKMPQVVKRIDLAFHRHGRTTRACPPMPVSLLTRHRSNSGIRNPMRFDWVTSLPFQPHTSHLPLQLSMAPNKPPHRLQSSQASSLNAMQDARVPRHKLQYSNSVPQGRAPVGIDEAGGFHRKRWRGPA